MLAEFGLHFGPDVEVRVHDSNQKSRFMVMPMRPEGTEGWTEEQLAAIITRDTMIGVALPQADWTASGAAIGGEGQRVSRAPYDVLLGTLDPDTRRAVALPELEHKPDPWESSMQATCECLSWRGALDNLERRHAEDDLGESMYHDFPVRARSVVVTAHTLMDRGAFTPEELRARMENIRERFNRA